MSAYRHDDLVTTPAGTARATERTSRFSPGQVISGLLGVVLAIVGIVAITRSGIDGSLNEPVSDILGFTHSSYVGLFELFVGLILLLGASSLAYRGAAGFAGALLVVGGVVLAAGNLRVLLEVGAKQSTGWMAIVFGAIAILAAVLPSQVRTSRVVETQPGIQ